MRREIFGEMMTTSILSDVNHSPPPSPRRFDVNQEVDVQAADILWILKRWLSQFPVC
jgi:hypothetical protein